MLRRRLVGETRAVQRGEQPIARAVTGEDAPRAVAAVGRRRQAADQQARPRIAETGDRLAPVFLVPKSRALRAGNLLAPGDEARTGATSRDAAVQEIKFRWQHQNSIHDNTRRGTPGVDAESVVGYDSNRVFPRQADTIGIVSHSRFRRITP